MPSSSLTSTASTVQEQRKSREHDFSTYSISRHFLKALARLFQVEASSQSATRMHKTFRASLDSTMVEKSQFEFACFKLHIKHGQRRVYPSRELVRLVAGSDREAGAHSYHTDTDGLCHTLLQQCSINTGGTTHEQLHCFA